MKRTVIALHLILFLLFSTRSSAKPIYFTTSDGVQLYVNVVGSGPPCVFVHGGPGSNSYYLEGIKSSSLLEQKIKMIYYDQRGCGRSKSPANGDFSLARMEKDLEEIRIFLGFKKWNVMGHSFGGIITTKYAYDYPKSISSLLLIHCTLNINQSLMSHIEFGIKELKLKDTLSYYNTTTPAIDRLGMIHKQLSDKKVMYKLMFRNQYEKDLNDTIDNPIGKKNRDFANSVWKIQEYFKDYNKITKNIKCPVLIMTGDNDFAIGPNHYKQFEFPNRIIVHYNGGHAPFQEEPQWFSEKITLFLETKK
jgi:proline iminopeptidase